MNQNSISSLDTLLNLDEQHDRKRQHELYHTSLKFDPNRPIYQQIIKLAHFLDTKSEQIFEEMVRNLEGLYPNQNVKGLLREYMDTQWKIDRYNQGYLNQVEEKEIIIQIKELRKEIEDISVKIEEVSKQKEEGIQIVEVLKNQIKQYEEFVMNNQDILDKMVKDKLIQFSEEEDSEENKGTQNGKKQQKQQGEEKQKVYWSQLQQKQEHKQSEFNKKYEALTTKVEQKVSDLQGQYDRVIKYKQSLQKQKSESLILKARQLQLRSQRQLIQKMALQVQLEADKLHQKISQLTKQLEQYKTIPIVESYITSSIRSVSAEENENENENEESKGEILEVKSYLGIQKVEIWWKKYWLCGLILCTILLGLWTWLR